MRAGQREINERLMEQDTESHPMKRGGHHKAGMPDKGKPFRNSGVTIFHPLK
jgi:hypothetical protein